MDDPIKSQKYWRGRARATREKAKQLRYAAPREMCRLLRVAEEYDKLAGRSAEWQGSAQLPAAEPPESWARPEQR
ncbi:hypothetical protein [Bradyrhizobium sp. BWA-3-5]|uniref:hypothetical protein n=1 Tax=Bradyrhizobium sp. BWA-3-5 TaxID=3080013 RepID=UPI00293E5EAF|nr:hypothetical protein [Bradyrhizobium sp. BWA-3-5]WOH67999.1 hypothetical protein RX331_09895 [Bradyrhizobium sp. BWA-3-5]